MESVDRHLNAHNVRSGCLVAGRKWNQVIMEDGIRGLRGTRPFFKELNEKDLL